MTRFVVHSLAILLVATGVSAAPVPKAIKAKPADLDGTWEVVELWSGMSDVAKLNPWVWEIRGEQLTIYNRENGALKLNDQRTKTTLVRPEKAGADAIDYTRDDGTTPMVFLGTVVVEGDRLILCFDSPGKARPTERKPFQSGWYYVFKRVSEK